MFGTQIPSPFNINLKSKIQSRIRLAQTIGKQMKGWSFYRRLGTAIVVRKIQILLWMTSVRTFLGFVYCWSSIKFEFFKTKFWIKKMVSMKSPSQLVGMRCSNCWKPKKEIVQMFSVHWTDRRTDTYYVYDYWFSIENVKVSLDLHLSIDRWSHSFAHLNAFLLPNI